VLTAVGSLEQKSVQLFPEWVNERCWDDIVSQCIPDLGGGNCKILATNCW